MKRRQRAGSTEKWDEQADLQESPANKQIDLMMIGISENLKKVYERAKAEEIGPKKKDIMKDLLFMKRHSDRMRERAES